MIKRLAIPVLPWAIAVALGCVLTLQHLPTALAAMRGGYSHGLSGHIRFASGDALPGGLLDGRPIAPRTIDGDLTLPSHCAPPYAAVVLMHGSLGVSAIQTDYARRLRDNCYAAFVVDSFAPRGVHSTVKDQLLVTTESMVVDAFAALSLLQSNSQIDPHRIAIAGWSKGGSAAERTMSMALLEKLAPGAAPFAAHVAFYPWCGEQSFWRRDTGAPILFLLARDDDWVSTPGCEGYAASLQGLGVKTRVEVFDGSHAFDNPELSRTYFPEASDSGPCNYERLDPGFREIGSQTIRPWDEFDGYFTACSRPGAHSGSNSVEAAKARKDFFEFLDSHLKGATP